MNYCVLETLTRYGLNTVIIAAISSILSFFTAKLFKNKLSAIKSYLPVCFAVLLQLIADMIFTYGAFAINANSFYSGIIAGSLSTAFNVFIKKTVNGKCEVFDKKLFFIEGLLPDTMTDEEKKQAATIILSVFTDNKENLSFEELTAKTEKMLLKELGLILTDKTVLAILCEILKTENKV